MEGLQDGDHYKREIYVYDKARLNTPEGKRMSQYSPSRHNKGFSASKSPKINRGRYPDTAGGRISQSPTTSRGPDSPRRGADSPNN